MCFYDSSNWKNAILEQSVELRQLIIRQTATITITSQENNNNIVFVECVCHYNNVKSVRRKRKKKLFRNKELIENLKMLKMRLFVVILSLISATFGSEVCPAPCSCSASGAVIDCSRRNLRHIPTDLPKNCVTL